MNFSSRFQFLLLLWVTFATVVAQRPPHPLRQCHDDVYTFAKAYRQLVKNTKRWEVLCESIEGIFDKAEEEVEAAEDPDNAEDVDCDALKSSKEALPDLIYDFLEQVDEEAVKLEEGHKKVCEEPCIDILPKGLVKLVKDRYSEARDAADELGLTGKFQDFQDRLFDLCDRIDALCKEGED